MKILTATDDDFDKALQFGEDRGLLVSSIEYDKLGLYVITFIEPALKPEEYNPDV